MKSLPYDVTVSLYELRVSCKYQLRETPQISLLLEYIGQADSLLRCAYRFGYTHCPININDVIDERDYKLWNAFVSNTKVRTERFKRVFVKDYHYY